MYRMCVSEIARPNMRWNIRWKMLGWANLLAGIMVGIVTREKEEGKMKAAMFCISLTMVALTNSRGANAQAPPEILAMNSLPNAGQLHLGYCAMDSSVCVTVKAICYGQCCDQGTADDMGYGCSGDIEGHVPPRFHYAKWSCAVFDSGKKITGKATKDYDRKDCHNPR